MTPKYEAVQQDERTPSIDSDEANEDMQACQHHKRLVGRKRSWLPWLLHFLLIAIYSVIIFTWAANRPSPLCSPCFSEKLLGAPIVWREHTYLSNIHSDVFDPYSKANPKVDEAWKSVVDTHVTAISEQEKKSLPGGRDTARLYGGEPGYAVLLEVFHQLHCLNAIRIGYYRGNNSEVMSGFADPGGHSDHCFSYLAQTLMCHADVGVMTTTWREEAQVFTADFNVTKQCRNFDAILQWAQTRKAKYNPPKHVTNS